MATHVNPKCDECQGSGWIRSLREQDEEWYDENPDRTRPSYYSTSIPCGSCNPQQESRSHEEAKSFLRKVLKYTPAGH